eukprot:262589-Prymnesium_polylepis.1
MASSWASQAAPRASSRRHVSTIQPRTRRRRRTPRLTGHVTQSRDLSENPASRSHVGRIRRVWPSVVAAADDVAHTVCARRQGAISRQQGALGVEGRCRAGAE